MALPGIKASLITAFSAVVDRFSDRRDEVGMLAGEIKTLSDMAERLRLSEERFHLAIEGSADIIWDWSVRDDKLFISPNVYKLLDLADGDSRIESMAQIANMLHPEEAKHVQKTMRDHLLSHAPYNIVHRLRTKDGSYRWFRARAQALWDDCGKPVRMLGSLSDFNEVVHAKEQIEGLAGKLRSQTEMLGQILALSPEAIIVMDEHFSITEFSAGAQETFGYEACEVIGKNIEILIPEELRERHAHLTMAFRDEEKSSRFTRQRAMATGRRKSGEEFPLAASISAIQPSLGTVYTVIVQDMTAEIAARQRLESAVARAENSNVLKSQFLANMSHEIRTPMNGVMGMAQLLLKTPLEEKQKRFANAIIASAKTLLFIINDILDLSKIEAGMLTLSVADINMEEMVSRAMSQVEGVAAGKNLMLRSVLDPACLGTFEGDAVRIVQILVNLLGNALKFTDEGEVMLKVYPGKDGSTFFAVRDTGPGISPAQLTVVFERFCQADGSMTRKHGGTGLGLSISLGLAKAMDGTLGVESTLGVGSTFWFEVPLKFSAAAIVATTQNAGATEVSVSPNLRVLVAEDNPLNQMLFAEILAMQRMNAHIVANGSLAIEALDKEIFDIVLMDLHMPVMNGEVAIRTIRASDKPYAGIPIIVVTADAMKDVEAHCFDAGADAVVTKPVDIALLVRTVLDVVGKKRGSRQAA